MSAPVTTETITTPVVAAANDTSATSSSDLSSTTTIATSSSTSAVAAPLSYPFQYISDIHLELRKDAQALISKLVPKADDLYLAGDIGALYTPALTAAFRVWSPKFRHIFYVPGNHEYYNTSQWSETRTMSYTQQLLRKICGEYSNVHYLDNSTYTLTLTTANGGTQALRVIGSTLWYTMANVSEQIQAHNGINDYRTIYVGRPTTDAGSKPRLLHPSDIKQMHCEAIQFLRTEITTAAKDQVPVIVMTHHLPTRNLIHEKYEHSSLNFAFATSLDWILEKEKHTVRAWICGHSHRAMVATIGNVPALLNPVGYHHEQPDEAVHKAFETTATIALHS
jgi:UDP-2,3-diacylglucosamine pyrophosphatase LpxH